MVASAPIVGKGAVSSHLPKGEAQERGWGKLATPSNEFNKMIKS